MMSSHIDALVDDYVLDLLSGEKRRSVELHASLCPRCMHLLAGERARMARVLSVLRSGTAPPAGRLEALWPGVETALRWKRRRPLAWPRLGWWLQWRAGFATFALLFAVVVVFFGTAGRFDGWLMDTHTPPAISETASPTASMTPTWTRSSFSLGGPPTVSAQQGTPEPVLVSYSPQPQPIPSAPALDGR